MKGRMFTVLFVGTMLLTPMSLSNRGFAQVNINVGINVPPPPPLVIPAPPSMFVIPGTYIYFAPEVEVDIFFYHGYWYRPYQGHWYRSGSYNGRWVYIAPKKVPTVLLNLPPDFRRVPPGHQRIPHEQLQKNWRTWEKEKHWEIREHEHGERERHD
jgi:hypothetical protein